MNYSSQKVAYPYFLLAIGLLVLQVIFGLIAAAQFIWPSFMQSILPFNIGREIHLNTMIFWLLLGLMGAIYYLVPDQTKHELKSTKLAWVQFFLLAITGVTAIVGFLFGWTEGREYIEAPRLLDWLIVVAALMFLYNIFATIVKSKRWDPILGVIFAGLAGLSVIYLFGMKFFGSMALDQFFWWFVIHLWVEGTWELIAAGITAYLLIKLTGAHFKTVAKWLYLEITLVLLTGILGIGHHYYWIGTPEYWLPIGGIFGVLEPLPILLMVFDTLKHAKGPKLHSNKVALLWVVGASITHFIGAGLMGAVQTLPSINKWTHGTQLTASHGHLAFYGAFAMLVIAAMYYMIPELKGVKLSPKRGIWAFWTMLLGMVSMSLLMFGAGITQVYLERMLGLDFSYVKMNFNQIWFVWRFISGIAFTVGVAILAIDIFSIASSKAVKLTEAPNQNVSV